MPTPEEVQRKVFSTPAVDRLNSIFAAEGYDFRLVGGAVRDILLGRWPKDLDFSSTASPENVKKLLEEAGIRVILTGLQHGTVTAVIDKEQYEITTLRLDEKINGVALDTSEYSDPWVVDALRRDLTINAMSMNAHGDIFDYFHGQDDIQHRRICFVGDAVLRIQEDYLRILRYFRFHGRICCRNEYDPSQLEAIAANVEGLVTISGERVWAELIKIFATERAPSILSKMLEVGVFAYIALEHVTEEHIREFSRTHRFGCAPATLLAALLDASDQLNVVGDSWHLSTAEKKLTSYVLLKRAETECLSRETVEDLLVDKIERDTVVELCKYRGQLDLAEYAKALDVPVFPVSGKVLISAGVKPGKEMGKLIVMLKDEWKKSRFALTQEELLALLARESS